MKFEKGESYFAVPCLEGARKTLVTMVGRRGSKILFTATQPLETTWVSSFDGREVARLRDENGCEFTVSPASHVDVALAVDVAEAMMPCRPSVKPSRVTRRGIFSNLGVAVC